MKIPNFAPILWQTVANQVKDENEMFSFGIKQHRDIITLWIGGREMGALLLGGLRTITPRPGRLMCIPFGLDMLTERVQLSDGVGSNQSTVAEIRVNRDARLLGTIAGRIGRNFLSLPYLVNRFNYGNRLAVRANKSRIGGYLEIDLWDGSKCHTSVRLKAQNGARTANADWVRMFWILLH